MRRGTPAAITFGKILCSIRTDAGMTMRQLAAKIGCPAATISQVEKGQRALKEPKLAIWSDALGISEEYLKTEWENSHSEPDPPIVRRRGKSINQIELEELFSELTGPERNRVLGYIDALIQQR